MPGGGVRRQEAKESEMPQEGIIARAFEVAREGKCQSLTDIRTQLKREGFSEPHAHLSGSLIKKQLSAILKGG